MFFLLGPLNDHSSTATEALKLRIGPNWSLSADLSQSVERVGGTAWRCRLTHEHIHIHTYTPITHWSVHKHGQDITYPPTSPRASNVWESRVSAHVFMTDTTILDHSRVFLSILRAPQRNHRFADRGARSNSNLWPPSHFSLGKRANHTIGVAKVEEFVYTSMVGIDTDRHDHSGPFSIILKYS